VIFSPTSILTIEKAETPTWMYGIVGIDFTASDPLIPPLEKLKSDLGAPRTQSGVPISAEPKRTLRPDRPNRSALGTKVVERWIHVSYIP
jgi:hypothetical protein